MSFGTRATLAEDLKHTYYFLRSFGIGLEQINTTRTYIFAGLFPEHSHTEHLSAAIEWLCQAQQACHSGGIAAEFSLRNGWGVAYPETSGYIIGTFLEYGKLTADPTFIDRSKRIGDWEISIQAPTGGIYSSEIVKQTRIFNTGQVILGWCLLYQQTAIQSYLDAALRAGDYLVALQEQDGSWQQDTYCGARTYHGRVSWSLIRLFKVSGERKYLRAARANLGWVVAQQTDNGWFKNCGFLDSDPIIHVISYTLCGLLNADLEEVDEIESLKLLPCVIKAADALAEAILRSPARAIPGMVPSSFDAHWHGKLSDSCLTGNAQLATFYYLLARRTNNARYKALADLILSATKRTQIVKGSLMEIRGALPGTFPLTKGYQADSYPNWATKFLADALLSSISTSATFRILA